MRYEVEIHYMSGKVFVFDLPEEEYNYLRSCLTDDMGWFMMAEEAINLRNVAMVRVI